MLASINKIESNFGQNMGPSSAGAVGWMQFMPSTWLRWGVDADGDGIADPWNATDAIYAAARYLAAAGGQTDIARGVFAYNHADWYVREVLDLAQVYGQGGDHADRRPPAAAGEARRGARSASSTRTSSSSPHRTPSDQLRSASRTRCTRRVEAPQLLSDRLAAERRAVLFDVRVDAARAATAARARRLEQAQAGARKPRSRTPRRRRSQPASGR